MIMSRNFVKIITSPCILEIPIAKQIKQEQLKMKKKKEEQLLIPHTAMQYM